MKYIYILGLVLLIILGILFNYKIIEGLTTEEVEKIEKNKNPILDELIINNNDDRFMGNVNTHKEELPSDYQTKQRKCSELSICEQLSKPEYEDCGYCLADEFDISKPHSFHYGHKGGTYTKNSNCYANQIDYVKRDGNEKRNVEWTAPQKYSSTTIGNGSFDKCKEIKTKHICEKQKQCNFMIGKEANIDKEENCGWCLDKTSDVGGNPYVRNLSIDPNDLKDTESNFVERLKEGGIGKDYYCSNNTERKDGDITKTDSKICKDSQIEKEEWKTITFPNFEPKHGKCGKDLIKNSDCNIFLKESCMKKTYDQKTGKEEEGPFAKNPDNCIKDLWVDIGFVESNFENFKNGKYVNEEGEIKEDNEIKYYMTEWRGADNFGEIQRSMINMAKQKIHSSDFYTAKKWNKILLDKNVCFNAFDTSTSELKPNQKTNCVNPCYQYQLDGTEWENTTKECQVKIFEKIGGKNNGLIHPINQSGKIPSVLQYFQATNVNEGFTIRDISKVSVIKDVDNNDNLISLNNDSLKTRTINQISSIYKKIKEKKNSINFEEKYKAHLQLDGKEPSELENKLCWIEFVKIMRTFPGTKLENRLLHIIITDEMKQLIESKKSQNNMAVVCNRDKTYDELAIECQDPSKNKLYKDNSITAYLSIVQGNSNNWKLEKKTYEDPGFDFIPWYGVINDYWKNGSNWNKFMYLMSKQDNVKLHLALNMNSEDNKRKIEISEKSPFYNLINSNTCKYENNMFLLEFNVENLGSGATLYIKSNDKQQKIVLSKNKNEILIHPDFYGNSIELIPLVKSSLTIKNVKIIRMKDKKYVHKLSNYKKKSKCDNVWSYCYWKGDIPLKDSLTGNETNKKIKYLLYRHRRNIDFIKFFGLMSDNDFYDLKYYKNGNEEITRTNEGIDSINNIIKSQRSNKIIRRNKPILSNRKDTKFDLNITANDQNWGWRTSRVIVDGGESDVTLGIGGKYDKKKGSGIYYGRKNNRNSNNITQIKKDITNNIVHKKSDGKKVNMKLKHYTSQSGGHNTYITGANLNVSNTPEGNNQNINLLSGVPGNKIKIIGNQQKKRGIRTTLDWVSFDGNKNPTFHNNYSYKLTGKGKDQGWGWSSSRIYGSQMNSEKAKNHRFDYNWKPFSLEGRVNEHNTDDKVKIHQYTSQNGGHETYIKDLSLTLNGGSRKSISDINIVGNMAKDLKQPTTTKIYEGFKNKNITLLSTIQNSTEKIIKNIKNYFFPEREGFFWLLFNPPRPRPRPKPRPPPPPPPPINFEPIYKAIALVNLSVKKAKFIKNKSKYAIFTFIGKDQGWGNDCNARASVNGVKSEKFGHKWKPYIVDFTSKLNTKNINLDVKLHKYGYPGCEVHINNGNIEIKNPSDIKTQSSYKRYNVGNHGVKDRSGGKTIYTK